MRITLAVLLLAACAPRVPITCTECGDVCVDLNVDSRNCGACGTACGPGTVCSAQVCVASCSATETLCSGGCFDLQTDPRSCGTCGNACASGFCRSGVCQTPPQDCDGGSCAPGCPAPLTTCGTTCTDTRSDPASCGMCGRGCDGGYCVASTCRPTCPAPLTQCGTRCVDTTVDPQHCGGCNAPCPGTSCVASVCSPTACQPGFLDCDGVVANGCESQEGCIVPITVGTSTQLINDATLVPLQLLTPFPGAALREADLSDDGLVVAFVSASTLVTANDTNGQPDVFVRDLVAGVTTNITQGANGPSNFVAVSGNGRFVAFVTQASNLGPISDTNAREDIYVYDRQTMTIEKVTQAADGGPTNDSDIDGVDLSFDGSQVVFASLATNLVDPPATTGGPANVHKLYRVDRATRRATLLTQAPSGTNVCPQLTYSFYYPRASDDAQRVTWATPLRITPEDQNGVYDQYVLLADAGLRAVSLLPDGGFSTRATCAVAGDKGDISGDGRTIAFAGNEDLMGLGDTSYDVFVRDLDAGTTTQLSTRPDGGSSAGESGFPTLSRNGTRITYVTSALLVTSPPLPTAESRCVLAVRSGSATVRTVPIAVGLRGEYPTCFGARISGNGHAVLFATTSPLALLDTALPMDGGAGGMDLYLRIIP